MALRPTSPIAQRAHQLLSLSVAHDLWETLGVPQLLTPPDADRTTTARTLADRYRRLPTTPSTLSHATVLLASHLKDLLRHLLVQHLTHHPQALTAVFEAQHHADPSLNRDALDLFAQRYPAWRAEPDPLRATELLLASLDRANPALAPLHPLIDDPQVAASPRCAAWLERAEHALAGSLASPPSDAADPTPRPILDVLRAPALAHPDDLSAQVSFVVDRFQGQLPTDLLRVALIAQGVLREETQTRLPPPGHHAPAPKKSAADFGMTAGRAASSYGGAGEDEEVEAFTQDQDWMPNVVLVAKSAYVWLHQLSAAYETPITRLDQIPDAELERLASLGFNALWLIGVWERSQASRAIKQRAGNPDALASAYALDDYQIAQDLGGHDAWARLKDRAAHHNLRLAGDMVPNHFGLDSRWVRDRPDLFLHLPESPYPNYTFHGPDLSPDPEALSIHLEDGYWDHSDAAVVFRAQHHHGPQPQARYIYHGNDGTQMPWNDTAQLDYLNPETRETVIQLILHVARMFPIIRFDAAMTLARRHIKRLWYPPPGQGGAIPSRAQRGMDDADFDLAIPNEFWREVVDRIQAEAPDTLLMAEAFWLMEGYFVRTLGMHRVYNSAFMHMLHQEDNAAYRAGIKEVLAFSPPILQRYVNFMNNPDEETAIAQFGDGDKAFGVALTMVTLPGLPLFGHGQVEGLTEKYGMEYARPLYDESPRQDLIDRHRHQLAPWMHQRHLFSHVEHFALYDLVAPDGQIQEDVYAWTNGPPNSPQRALFAYNNAYGRAEGRIHTAAPVNRGSADAPELVTRSLSQALGVDHLPSDTLVLFSDTRRDLHLLRTRDELDRDGLPLTLDGYQTALYHPIRPLSDDDPRWRTLHARASGAPIHDLDTTLAALRREPVARAFDRLLPLIEPLGFDPDALTPALTHLLALLHDAPVSEIDPEPLGATLARLARLLPLRPALLDALTQLSAQHAVLLPQPRAFLDALILLRALPATLHTTWDLPSLLPDTLAHAPLVAPLLRLAMPSPALPLGDLLDDARDLLGVHTHDGTTWFRHEPALALLDALDLAALLDAANPEPSPDALAALIARRATIDQAQYDFDRLRAALTAPKEAAPEAEDAEAEGDDGPQEFEVEVAPNDPDPT